MLTDPDMDLWDITKWQHGRRTTTIPTIKEARDADDGGTPVSMATTFCHQFFDLNRPKPSLLATVDTAFLPTRPLHPLARVEIHEAIFHGSNKSAPGSTGIGYQLLK
jgi:hypothetical protein